MKTLFINEPIKYEGHQLCPHWIYKNFNIQGDAIVAFVGECDVKLTEMVDIEDVINNEPIYSKSMLSFISEQFNVELVEGVFRQRLLMCIIKEALEKRGILVVRDGDDLFVESTTPPPSCPTPTGQPAAALSTRKKLSVSIATKSITSTLIHTGLNITSEGTPIPTAGLESDLGIHDINCLAEEIMLKYSQEIDDIVMASTKVRGV